MPLNSTLLFDVHPISLEMNRVAHPVSGIVGETLQSVRSERFYCNTKLRIFTCIARGQMTSLVRRPGSVVHIHAGTNVRVSRMKMTCISI